MCPLRYVVAVTGFAPYAGDTPWNTSAFVRDCIPSVITQEKGPTIQVLKYPHDIESTFSAVGPLPPKLWAGDPAVYGLHAEEGSKMPISAILHIGMRRRSPNYFIESVARRDVYSDPGTDGKNLDAGDKKAWWGDSPEVLKVGWNVSEAVESARIKRPDAEVEVSSDAGSSFCEMILYGSLVELYRHKSEATVGFLHVPKGKEDETILRGADIATTVITAMVKDIRPQQEANSEL